MMTTQQVAAEIVRANPDYFPAGRLLSDLGVTDAMDIAARQSRAAEIEAGLRPIDPAVDSFVARLGIDVDEIERVWLVRGIVRVLMTGPAPTPARLRANVPGGIGERLDQLGQEWWAKVEEQLESK